MKYKIVRLRSKDNDLFTVGIEQDPVGIPREEYLNIRYPLHETMAAFKKRAIGLVYDTSNRPFEGITVPASDLLDATPV